MDPAFYDFDFVGDEVDIASTVELVGELNLEDENKNIVISSNGNASSLPGTSNAVVIGSPGSEEKNIWNDEVVLLSNITRFRSNAPSGADLGAINYKYKTVLTNSINIGNEEHSTPGTVEIKYSGRYVFLGNVAITIDIPSDATTEGMNILIYNELQRDITIDFTNAPADFKDVYGNTYSTTYTLKDMDFIQINYLNGYYEEMETLRSCSNFVKFHANNNGFYGLTESRNSHVVIVPPYNAPTDPDVALDASLPNGFVAKVTNLAHATNDIRVEALSAKAIYRDYGLYTDANVPPNTTMEFVYDKPNGIWYSVHYNP